MAKTRILLARAIVGASAVACALGCSSAGNEAPRTADAGPAAFVRPVLEAGTDVDAGAAYTRIDDMEGNGIQISWPRPPGTIPRWAVHVETPELGHLLSPDPSVGWSYAAVPTPYETFPGITSAHAARLRTLAPLVNTYGADMHIIFDAALDAGAPIRKGYGRASADLSAFKGITFWGMADPNQTTTTIAVTMYETNTWPEGGRCVDRDGGTDNCFNGFIATRALAGSFKRYTIDFSELTVPAWGYQAQGPPDLTHVYLLIFQIDTPGGASSASSLTFDVWIDDLYFANK